MCRVLIVEDDRDFAESLVLGLGVRQCLADVACSGREAVAACREQRYDLVFMDIKLPDQNGLEILSELLSMDPQTRIVMMTGFSEPALLDAARQAGAVDVLRKPFKMRQMFRFLEADGDQRLE